MSRAKELYKGKPSRMIEVLSAGTAFEDGVYCKPPSPAARAVFYTSLNEVSDLEEKGNNAEAIEKLNELSLKLILITNCDETGKPFFLNDDKDFLQNELDKGYYDAMVSAGCEILGLPETLRSGLLLDMLKGEELQTEKKQLAEAVSSNQTTQENQQE
jgi:hypothetical protein